MTHCQLMRTWFERVWNQGDVSFVDEALAEPCEVTGLSADTITSRSGFRGFHQTLNAAFSEIHVEVKRLMECGDEVSGAVVVHATHRGTGKRISFQSSFFGTVRAGKIVEAANLVDYFGLLSEMGVLEPAVLGNALAPVTSDG